MSTADCNWVHQKATLKRVNFKVNVKLAIICILVISFNKNNKTKCKCFQDDKSNNSINSQTLWDVCRDTVDSDFCVMLQEERSCKVWS